MNSFTAALRKQLKDMERLTNQMATMHSGLHNHYTWWNSALNILLLVISACLLSLAFISEEFVQRTIEISPDVFKWINGIAAIANFSFGLVLLVWQPSQKAAAHSQAVAHYTKAKYEIKRLKSKEVWLTEEELQLTEEELQLAEEKLQRIEAQYLEDRDLPRIPEDKFLPLKRWHLIKVDLSKQLDKNPFEPLWLIQLKFWLNVYKKTTGKP